jgi:hypothetical protein
MTYYLKFDSVASVLSNQFFPGALFYYPKRAMLASLVQDLTKNVGDLPNI